MSATSFDSTELNLNATTVHQRWSSVFVRMMWKEFRVVLPFLAVVAGTMVFLAALVEWAMKMEAWGALYAIVVLFPLLFALGCGGMSYAGEREDGTWDWLRRIAAPPSAVCAAKIVVGLSCSLLLAAVAWWVLAWYASHARQTWDVGNIRLVLLLIGVSVTLLVSQIVSSLIKNVFVALIVSGVALAPVLSIGLAFGTDHTGRFFGSSLSEAQFAAMCVGWIVVLLSLILCEFSLADCWLKDVAPWRGGLIGLMVNPLDRKRLMLSAWGYQQSPLSFLVSREWRLARPWLWSFGLTLFLPIGLSAQNPYGWFDRGGSFIGGPLLVLAMSLLALVPTMLGVWAYQPDQRELRFRFFADRGVSPTMIWYSKHLVRMPMLLLLVLAAASLGILWSISQGLARNPNAGSEAVWLLGGVLSFTVMSYSAGQLIGQLIRSPITSSFLAAVFALLLAGWTICLRLLHVPFLFDLAPIAILFGASWLRSPDWLLERTTWRARLQLAASVILPFALLYGAVGWYRLSGLPRVARKPPTIAETEAWQTRDTAAHRELQQFLNQLDDDYGNEFAAMTTELKSLHDSLIFKNAEGIDGGMEAGAAGGFTGFPGGFGGGAPMTVEEQHRHFLQELQRAEAHAQQVLETIGKLFPFLEAEELPGAASTFLQEFRTQFDSLIDDTRHSATITKYREELLAQPRSLLAIYYCEVQRRHFEKTRQRLRELGRTIRPHDAPSSMIVSRVLTGIELLELHAQDRMSQGDVDESLSLRWAAECFRHYAKLVLGRHSTILREGLPGFLVSAALSKKSELIRQIIRESNQMPDTLEWLKNRSQASWAQANDVFDNERLRAGLDEAWFQDSVHPSSPTSLMLLRLFPWELPLARRESTVYYARELAMTEAIQDVVHDRAVDRITWESGLGTPLTQTEIDRPIAPSGLLKVIPSVESQQIELRPENRSQPISTELERRQVVLLLALIAWHHDHGELPESLEQLVGPYLDKLPLDPLTGKSFVYQKSPKLSVLPPWASEQRVPQLRVRSLDDTRDELLELRVKFTPRQLPDELFTKP